MNGNPVRNAINTLAVNAAAANHPGGDAHKIACHALGYVTAALVELAYGLGFTADQVCGVVRQGFDMQAAAQVAQRRLDS